MAVFLVDFEEVYCEDVVELLVDAYGFEEVTGRFVVKDHVRAVLEQEGELTFLRVSLEQGKVVPAFQGHV